MNEDVAAEILQEQIDCLRSVSYSDLVLRINADQQFEVTGRDGRPYQVEITCVWDSKHGGDIRVIVSVDDGGIGAFMPLTDGFIISSDGSFVDK